MAVQILLIVISLLILLFCVAYKLSNLIVSPKVLSYEELRERELCRKRLDLDFYQSIDKEEIWIQSKYGYRLAGMVLNDKVTLLPQNQTKIAVLCHGNKQGMLGSMVYAKPLMEEGFTCIIYDHRNHGKSDKRPTTMGYYEKHDLKTVVDWCYQQYGSQIRIVTFGESMGGATVLCHLAIDDRIAATIADCAYSDLRELERHIIHKYMHLPAFLFIPFARIILKTRANFSDRDVRPMTGSIHSKTPILFIHGDSDTYVPTKMSITMYEKRTGPKELYLAPGAEHALSCVVDYEKYKEVVKTFLKKYYE